MQSKFPSEFWQPERSPEPSAFSRMCLPESVGLQILHVARIPLSVPIVIPQRPQFDSFRVAIAKTEAASRCIAHFVGEEPAIITISLKRITWDREANNLNECSMNKCSRLSESESRCGDHGLTKAL
jgi:hypothetical protein